MGFRARLRSDGTHASDGKGFVDLDDTLAQFPDSPALPLDVAERFLERTLTYCQLNSQLRNWNNLRVFKLTMKHHYLLHAAWLSKYINPRKTWCFRGEDYMSKIKRVIASCCKGNAVEAVSGKTVQKVCIAMHCQLAGWAREVS